MNTTREREVCRNCTEGWINSHLKPRKIVDHVEVCVIVAAVFMIVLVILSPRRRQSRSIIIRYGVEIVFILSFPLLSYTMGLMKGQIITSELYAVWAIFLAMLFGGTNGISFQKLDGNKQDIKLYMDYVLILFYCGTIISNFENINKTLPHVWFISMALNFLLAYKSVEQRGAAKLASKPSAENGIRWLTLYMKREHQLSTSYDPGTMKGYKYPVLIHSPTPITLDTIWCDNIGVLSPSNCSPPIRRLKDLCLSFSLFHLVVRRYFGYTCPESKLDKTHDLVLVGLLQMDQDYERAFRVIEAELAFLYDFFFTKYAYIMYGNEVSFCALSLIITFLSMAVGTWSLSVLNIRAHSSILDDLLVQISTGDVAVTKIALVVLSVCQLLQIWTYLVSDWAKVSLICKYVTRPSWQGNGLIEKLILLQGRPHRWLRYWRSNIGQYSIIDSIRSGYWDRLKYHFFESRRTLNSVELTVEVKKAVAQAIKIYGQLSYGMSALTRHRVGDELCWACPISDEFTLAHSILVWHVATSYCELSQTVRCPDGSNVNQNQVVAISLSRYCAYLVAFAPTLLPVKPIEAECALDDLESEVKGALQNIVSPREKYENLRDMQTVTDAIPPSVADANKAEENSAQAQLLAKGVMLGKVLESMENDSMRWDLLADFWAEMLVCIAPSDNVAGHIELLAQGGEFVTHVWALLMHAGILERPAAATATP